MPSRRGSIVKVSPFVPTAVETTVKPAPAELAAAFAKLKTAKPDFPYDGQPDREVVAVVDPYSTGACVAAAAAKRGFKIIHVMSAPESGTMEEMVPKHLRGLSYIATLRAACGGGENCLASSGGGVRAARRVFRGRRRSAPPLRKFQIDQIYAQGYFRFARSASDGKCGRNGECR